MKDSLVVTTLALALIGVSSSQAAIPVRTSIDLQAEISTSVRVYVAGNDVTNGSISLQLNDKNGYMYGVTPAFNFVGNASAVSLSLKTPVANQLISENGDAMQINPAWIRVNVGDVSASYPLNNQAVYPTVQDIPDPSQGVKVQFTSAKRSETYPLGTYSGTYEVIVTPSV
jgi:hypothetical protein